jgi:hypothetical protein
VYAGHMTHWWGPGWISALSMSNNAHPIPQIGFSRIDTKPSDSPWLSWMGPWQAEFLSGNSAVTCSPVTHWFQASWLGAYNVPCLELERPNLGGTYTLPLFPSRRSQSSREPRSIDSR